MMYFKQVSVYKQIYTEKSCSLLFCTASKKKERTKARNTCINKRQTRKVGHLSICKKLKNLRFLLTSSKYVFWSMSTVKSVPSPSTLKRGWTIEMRTTKPVYM